MSHTSDRDDFQRKLIDALYVEAMAMAEGARGYFDGIGRQERDALDPVLRVGFSCESLKVTTRLMHIIAWILTQRAVEAGELQWTEARDPVRRLGASPESDAVVLAKLPPHAAALAHGSIELHRRVERLDQMADEPAIALSPVQALQARLGKAF